MASLTMMSALSVPTSPILTYAKAPAAIVASSPAAKNMSTVNFAIRGCGNRVSRLTAIVTCRTTGKHTTRHNSNPTTKTTASDSASSAKEEKSLWDKIVDLFLW